MKKYILIYTLIAGALFSGCEDYLDVNTDPNNPTQVPPELILPVGQDFTARWMHSDRRVSHLGNMIMYNWSESAGYSWYNDEFLYRADASTFYSSIFDDAYERALKQYQEISKFDDEYLAYKAIANIMKAYTYQILVDFYGDIPYSEALMRSENNAPAYDDAQAIYDDLIVQLTESIEMINTAQAEPTSIFPEDDDIIFNGDMEQWKQFANTIKLRILTRESDVKDASYISAELAVIEAEGSGYITDNVTVNPGYLAEANKQNPFFASFGADENGNPVMNFLATSATDYIIEYLQNNADPRLDYLYEEPDSGHKGVPQGITASQEEYAPELVSNIGPGLLIGSTQGSIIFTLAEVYFNLAELALKGFEGDPESLYNAGVAASFATLGAGDPSAYLAQNVENVNYAASSDKLEAIITQKWLAVNGITAEQSWFDWVRTGYPEGLPVSVEVPNLQRPLRLSYPASEISTNAGNVPSQPNVFQNPVFWAN